MSLLGGGLGLGLRTEHYARASSGACDGVDWFEVITENFLVAGGNPRRVLRAARAHRPIVLHGVSLSIGSLDPLDERYLAAVRALCDELEPALVSDHLCWSSLGGHTVHDLWPVPYIAEALDHIAPRVAHVQERLGRRIYLENPSSYTAFEANELGEAEFLAELARRTDCGILLDVNNVYVSCTNNRWDIDAYLAALPLDRIGYVHVAGHAREGELLNDTHDAPVSEAVWAIHRALRERTGLLPTCLERDANIPAFDVLALELARAR